jgi:hypothetical protein
MKRRLSLWFVFLTACGDDASAIDAGGSARLDGGAGPGSDAGEVERTDGGTTTTDAGGGRDARVTLPDADIDCPDDWHRVGELPFVPNLACVEPWITNDASYERIEGWGGGPGLRIWPPNTGEGMAAVGQFNGVPTPEQFHLGFLYRVGPTLFAQHGNTKQIILWREDEADRPMIITRPGDGEEFSNSWRAIGACDNTVCQYQSGEFWPMPTETFKYGHPETNAPGRYGDEWVWFEYVVTATENQVQVWTQDGEFEGHYVSRTQAEQGHRVTDVDGIGGYWPQGRGYDEGAYYDIAFVVLSDGPIGPPW